MLLHTYLARLGLATLDFRINPSIPLTGCQSLISSAIRSRDQIEPDSISSATNRLESPRDCFHELRAADLPGALGASCDPATNQDLSTFHWVPHKIRGSERSVAQARERIANCADFRSTQSANLTSWIDSHAATPKH